MSARRRTWMAATATAMSEERASASWNSRTTTSASAALRCGTDRPTAARETGKGAQAAGGGKASVARAAGRVVILSSKMQGRFCSCL